MDYEKLQKKKFGQRLALSRAKAGLTQSALAWRLKVNQNEIAIYEKGKRVPNDVTLIEMAKVLEVDPVWLKYGDCDTLEKVENTSGGKTVSICHVNGSKPAGDHHELSDLNAENQVLVKSMINLLALDEDQKKLEELVHKNDSEFAVALKAAKKNAGFTKAKFSAIEALSALNDIYPDLYQQVSDGKLELKDAFETASQRAKDTWPDIKKAMDENIRKGDNLTEEDYEYNRKIVFEHIIPEIRKNITQKERKSTNRKNKEKLI